MTDFNPLDIQPFSEFENEGMGDLGYQCKEHVEPALFCENLLNWWGYATKPDSVRHTYLKNLPNGSAKAKESVAGRGAFAVTTVDIADCEQILSTA